jgi:hypothetical protein
LTNNNKGLGLYSRKKGHKNTIDNEGFLWEFPPEINIQLVSETKYNSTRQYNPKYIHTSLGLNRIKGLYKNELFFFELENGIFHNGLKAAAKNKKYGGYLVYTIDIPNDMFTTSFDSTTKKVVKINKDNVDEFRKMLLIPSSNNKHEMYPTFTLNGLKEYNPNIIGIDLTNNGKRLSGGYKILCENGKKSGKNFNFEIEGFLWEFPPGIKIRLASETKYFITKKM